MSAVRSLPARKAVLTVSAVSIATALLVSGCDATQPSSSSQPIAQSYPSAGDDYVQVCEDTASQQRVEDDKCDGNLTGSHYRPSYYHYSSMIPAIGAGMLAGYLLSAPARSNVYRGAAPLTGGYAPATRPNSGFLKVPDDFVGGPPVVPPAPSTAPKTQVTTPPQPSTPQSGTKVTTPPKKSTDDASAKKKTDTSIKQGTTLKAPSRRK